jgi:hypothetical protein
MTIQRPRPMWLAAALGLTVCWTSGCQTYFPPTLQTLPSGYYLQHPPQYIPATPPFPLPKEEAALEQASNQQLNQPPGR